MISSPSLASRVRAFDLILNLGVHAQLLEPMVADDATTIEEDYSQESYFNNEAQLVAQENRRSDSLKNMGASSAIDKFESWILSILYEILLLLVQVELVYTFHLFAFLFSIFLPFRNNILLSILIDLGVAIVVTHISRELCHETLVIPFGHEIQVSYFDWSLRVL